MIFYSSDNGKHVLKFYTKEAHGPHRSSFLNMKLFSNIVKLT